jgi:hypothetical protein
MPQVKAAFVSIAFVRENGRMTDDELMQGFESGTLDEYPHVSHVRVAWCHLGRDPILIALARFRAALKRFAAGKGKPDRYHETITIALLLMIADRRGPAGESWDGFAARNPDLLQWPCPALTDLYGDGLLDSPRAREMFVLPEL